MDYELLMRQAAKKKKQFLWHEVLILMERASWLWGLL